MMKGAEQVENSADLHTWTAEFESAVSVHLVWAEIRRWVLVRMEGHNPNRVSRLQECPYQRVTALQADNNRHSFHWADRLNQL